MYPDFNILRLPLIGGHLSRGFKLIDFDFFKNFLRSVLSLGNEVPEIMQQERRLYKKIINKFRDYLSLRYFLRGVVSEFVNHYCGNL